MGYEIELSCPQTLNEKIQWLKLYDRTPLHTICADKLAARDFVEEKVGREHLIELVLSSGVPDDIKAENLPDYPVIIKTNHDNGGVVIVNNKEKLNWPEVRLKLRSKLKRNYFYRNREWPYLNIEPTIIVEKLLLDEKGNMPMDYKVHCFHGQPKMITVDIDRFDNHKQNFYDTEWNLLDCEWYYPIGSGVPKPKGLASLLRVAEKLSKAFIYVRVDLYLIDGNVFFGELTFYQGAGLEKFSKVEWDYKLGSYIDLSVLNKSI